MTTTNIYKVSFKEPPLKDSEKTEFFFTSLTAIYDVFTPEQVGCKVTRLWNIGVTDGNPYNGRLCQITKETLSRKAQNNPCKGREIQE